MSTRSDFYKLIDTLAGVPLDDPERPLLMKQLHMMREEIERADAGTDAVVRDSDTQSKIVSRELSQIGKVTRL